MDLDDLKNWRKKRMQALAEKYGSNSALGRLLGYRDGAYVGQMIGGHRPISEKTVAAVHALPGCAGWFAEGLEPGDKSSAINLDNNPDYPAIRKVRFRLSAGASGFAVEYQDDEGMPIVFGRKWLEKKRLNPAKLFAVEVSNGSMEPGLSHGDTVVVNTEATEPVDGKVFAVNYEGEMIIKRLVRDSGEWWLGSDNADQRRYPRKLCDEHCNIIGEIVHKQSDEI